MYIYRIIYLFVEEESAAIYITGREKLYLGEKATFFAFIDSKISSINKIFWRRKNNQGNVTCSEININDGKYSGSKTILPSTELHIHFVCTKDEGIYEVVVESFNKLVYKSINLDVLKGGEDTDVCIAM